MGNGGEGRGRGRGGEGKGREGDWCPPHDLFARRPCSDGNSITGVLNAGGA